MWMPEVGAGDNGPCQGVMAHSGDGSSSIIDESQRRREVSDGPVAGPCLLVSCDFN